MYIRVHIVTLARKKDVPTVVQVDISHQSCLYPSLPKPKGTTLLPWWEDPAIQDKIYNCVAFAPQNGETPITFLLGGDGKIIR
jgi:hypothetical protein